MRSWLLRGLIFAFLQTVIRIIQTIMINTWETQAVLISIFLQLIFAVVALAWGYVDGRSDANAEPDPDRRRDLSLTWLIGGLVAGVLSGALCLIISLFYSSIYVMAPVNELTTFAAYTALLVFLMAMLGVALGRFLVDRRYNKEHPVPRHGGEEGPDTDVFAAVSSEETQREATEGRATPEAPTRPERAQ
jgi:MFS family permease